MEPTMRVVTVGSVNVDATSFAPRTPAPGETILGTDFQLGMGGKGANQAAAVAQAGASSIFVGCIGTDVFADVVIEALDGFGVDRTHLDVVEGATGIAHIRVAEGGENSIVVIPLANASLTERQIDEALDASGASVMLTQLEISIEMTTHAIHAAHDRGIAVVLDPAPAAQLPDELFALVDVVKPNETEARILTGIEVTDLGSAERAGRWFLDRGAKAALITLAGAGAVLVSAEGVRTFAAHRVTAIDSTAAGDTFTGYLGAAMAAGERLPDAVELAMAAGAIAVTRSGASSSIPSRREVDALLASSRP